MPATLRNSVSNWPLIRDGAQILPFHHGMNLLLHFLLPSLRQGAGDSNAKAAQSSSPPVPVVLALTCFETQSPEDMWSHTGGFPYYAYFGLHPSSKSDQVEALRNQVFEKGVSESPWHRHSDREEYARSIVLGTNSLTLSARTSSRRHAIRRFPLRGRTVTARASLSRCPCHFRLRELSHPRIHRAMFAEIPVPRRHVFWDASTWLPTRSQET
ncbi:hypothetical protein NEOLEDRAFT_467680 [Neolentinus lepideus HHB14362 ss-1]|uniref:Uncharacterized protein n=1 Tax=Neolentinus lepideus HHB14362 ss-1 TaxID=1314782 RepID=A0A165VIG8_9AGAM|nr:hypothetical protein NEOLEDRAFT_467680 [Neolentinus lepideus HHB14362 ss-1]